ncbi:MAG: GNAT family N-acetyltransferase [Candidatus Lokiarchaeota archaeon]|nr:GNAT family N-acetyltransferase [Candidatus Lokiarchaeota archaeon]MBD3201426.1 GNAT family N-acetyltransferase [Candidatus Lokiarchaeota archaeon]
MPKNITKNNDVISDIKIRDVLPSDNYKIISLIKSIHGFKYPEIKFYDPELITIKINRAIKKSSSAWKIATLNNKIVGQMLLETNKSIGTVKLAMVDKKYHNVGIGLLLAQAIDNEIKTTMKNCFNFLYAIVQTHNEAIIAIIKKFGFKKLGNVPRISSDVSYSIYGRVEKDSLWKLISPIPDLSKIIFSKVILFKLRRLLSVCNSNFKNHNRVKIKGDYHIEKVSMNHEVYLYFYEYYPSINKSLLAKLTWDKLQKSWYDFQFVKKISHLKKCDLLLFLNQEFSKDNEINSLSTIIDIDDNNVQKFILDIGFQYYGFLPFYLGIKDAILFGKSKITKEVNL